MNLTTIIEKKKEEFVEKYYDNGHFGGSCYSGWEEIGDEIRDTFLEKAIRESVEETLREVSNFGTPERGCDGCEMSCGHALMDFKELVKEFMK